MKLNKKGFTLIELLIVVAIIAILAAIAIPQFNAYRVRGFNGAAQSDLRNAKTVQESVFAEYRAMGSSEQVTSINNLAVPTAQGTLLPGPLPGATGTVVAAAGAIVTRIDTNNDQAYDNQAGFGVAASNNVFLQIDLNAVGAAVDGVNFTQYQMRAKHRDGNRGFATNTNPAICYSENNLPQTDANAYMGSAMTPAGGKPSNPTDMVTPCGGMVSDGSPVATYVSL